MQRQILSELLLVWLGNTQYAINCTKNSFGTTLFLCWVVMWLLKNVMLGLNLLDLLEIHSF